MNFGKPVQISDGVHQFRAIGARVTVLIEGSQAILVDAGSLGSLSSIRGGLKALGLTPEQVARVVVTHAHPDHSGGLGELLGGRETPVDAHRLDADVIEGVPPPPVPRQRGVLSAVTQPLVARLMGRAVPVGRRLEDGDVIPFGTEVRVVHLPGHTDGSIALYLPEKRVVISGDALQYKFARSLSPPGAGVTQDPAQAMRSLEKLLDLDFETMCFSHYPPLRDDPRGALQRLIEQHHSPE